MVIKLKSLNAFADLQQKIVYKINNYHDNCSYLIDKNSVISHINLITVLFIILLSMTRLIPDYNTEVYHQQTWTF